MTADVDRTAPTGREMTLRPRERHEALQEASREQETAAWKTEYAVRAGIEGTISERVRGFGLLLPVRWLVEGPSSSRDHGSADESSRDCPPGLPVSHTWRRESRDPPGSPW